MIENKIDSENYILRIWIFRNIKSNETSQKTAKFLWPILYKMDFMKGNVVLVKVDYFSILVSWLHQQIVKKVC